MVLTGNILACSLRHMKGILAYKQLKWQIVSLALSCVLSITSGDNCPVRDCSQLLLSHQLKAFGRPADGHGLHVKHYSLPAMAALSPRVLRCAGVMHMGHLACKRGVVILLTDMQSFLLLDGVPHWTYRSYHTTRNMSLRYISYKRASMHDLVIGNTCISECIDASRLTHWLAGMP